MKAELCRDLDPALVAGWRDLAARAGACPFAGPAWHAARRAVYGDRRVGYLVATDGRELAGIWPLKLGYATRPAGQWLADYLSPLLAPGVETVALEAMAEELARARVHLLDLPRQTGPAPSLADALSAHGYATVTLAGEACPRTDLSGGFAAVEGRLPPGLRKLCRYAERRLGRMGTLAADLVPPAQAAAAMAQLMDWHTSRFRSRATPGSFYGRRRLFHQQVASLSAQDGSLRLARLRLDGRTLALLYALRGGERYFYYAAGFDPKMARFSPGLLLLRETIRMAAAEGMQVFDFLRGDEAYKEPWTTQRPRLHRVVAAAPGRGGYLPLAAIGNRVEMGLRGRLGGGVR